MVKHPDPPNRHGSVTSWVCRRAVVVDRDEMVLRTEVEHPGLSLRPTDTRQGGPGLGPQVPGVSRTGLDDVTSDVADRESTHEKQPGHPARR